MISQQLPSRPKLLFLSQVLPYPPDGGVKIRTYHILRLLSQAFDVTALCFYRTKGGAFEQDVEASVAALQRLAKVEAFPLPQEGSSARLVWDHMRSLARLRTYTVFSYESEAFRSRLGELVRSERFDLVHADSLDLSAYFPQLSHLPLVCVHHDAQSVLLQRRSTFETNLARRAYLQFQSRLMRKEEASWCPRVTMNVTVSDLDRYSLGRCAPSEKFMVVPNGVDTDHLRPMPSNDQDIVFVGGTTWFPNKDALDYFARQILPELRKTGVEAPVRWVGRATQNERNEYGRFEGLEVTGYVEDIRPYVRDAGCYIVPLRVGGGTRIKILDAWAMGKAVVSTSIGCEGLGARDGENILIRDRPAEFAAAIREVLNDSSLRRRLGQNARETVERDYSWDRVGSRMLAQYRAILSKNGNEKAATAAPL